MTLKFNKYFFRLLIAFNSLMVYGQKVVNDSLPEYQVLYNSAVILIDSAHYKEAIPMLKKAVKKKPDFWAAYNKMAYAKMQLKQYKEAEKDLDKSEKISSMNYETEKLKGINFFFEGRYNESKTMLDTALLIYREEGIEDPGLFYYRAQLMFKGKNYKMAIQACETAVDLNPKYLEAYVLKAKIRFAVKEYNHAIKELNDAIKWMSVDKADYEAYKLRAKSKFETGDYKGAVKDWDVYIEAIPKEEEALISRAAAKININDNSGAIADLDQAIKLNGNNAVSYCYRGVAKGGNRNYIEALKDLDYSIRLKFDYSTAYVNRAAIRMAGKDKRGACEDLEKADGLGNETAIQLIEKYCKQH